MPLLEVRNLTIRHRSRTGFSRRWSVTAVDDVSFALMPGERLGLVGESGCGKSSLCMALLGFAPMAGGQLLWEGTEFSAVKPEAGRSFRQAIQMVFQDPGGSLNPRMRIGQLLSEALLLHGGGKAAARRQQAVRLLQQVGLGAAAMERYPHEFSGGQRQRIAIARALSTAPRLLIADEPVSALDVCVQAQVLEVLLSLQRERGFALLFVAHDLAVVRSLCTRALVMYRGRMVEQGPVEKLFSRPIHPYTQALLAAVPDVDRALAQRAAGGVWTRGRPTDNGSEAAVTQDGCLYRGRCPVALPVCEQKRPEWRESAPGHFTACHAPAGGRASVDGPRGTAPDTAGSWLPSVD